MSEQPTRTDAHDQLEVFLGDWRATGRAHDNEAPGPDQPTSGSPWSSTHQTRWHTGEYFMIQDERATVGDSAFDTLSLIGVDQETGRYVMRTFDNGGHFRQYELTVADDQWTIIGSTERATIVFTDDNRRQTIHWEWKPGDEWVPLCDRVAIRRD
jgi:hypothetical protein